MNTRRALGSRPDLEVFIGIASSGGSGLSQALTAFAAIIGALGTLTLGVAAALALRKRRDAAARTTDAG